MFSVTVYVVYAKMPPNSFVFVDVPSSTRLKLSSGAGLAENGSAVVPFVSASLTIVIDAGKYTAAVDNERSWLPPRSCGPSSRMWYGDPLIATAEFSSPQAKRVAMRPPQAKTGLATVGVKVITIDRLLLPSGNVAPPL